MTEKQREKLILDNVPLVHAIVKEIYQQRYNIPYKDYVQSGIQGLINAVDKFDPDKGPLGRYAAIWIKARIKELVHSYGPGLSGIDKNMLGAYRLVDSIANDILNSNENVHSIVPDFLIKEHPEFQRALEKSRISLNQDNAADLFLERYKKYKYEVLSYDGIPIKDGTPQEDLFPSRADDYLLVSDEEDFTDHLSKKDFISNHLLKALSERQREVVELYYGFTDDETPLNFSQIGTLLNITKASAAETHKRAIKALKKAVLLYKDSFPEYFEN